VFVVREGEVATARADNRILNGITRVLVLTLAREMGYMVNERDIREGELAQADEIFFTSTRMEIMPVSRLNGEPVGDGRPGEVVGTLLRAFQERVDASREVQA
jgi:D-alanine transaminase